MSGVLSAEDECRPVSPLPTTECPLMQDSDEWRQVIPLPTMECPLMQAPLMQDSDTNLDVSRGDNLTELLNVILERLNSANTATEDFNILRQLLTVITQLLLNVKEQLDIHQKLSKISKFSLSRFAACDDDIRFWTGFYSHDALIIFYETLLEPNVTMLQYWGTKNSQARNRSKCGPRRSILPIDEFFMTLVKLKQGSANKDLAERFNISPQHVSRIFISWVNFLHTHLVGIDIWMSRGRIRKYSPPFFRELYTDVRVILDCTEMQMERPSDFEAQAATYSTYKSCNTLKGLVGMSPSGVVTFISDTFEGSISDNQIIFDSGILDLLQPEDAIMADRGFTCREILAKRKIRLITPHFLHGQNQMNLQDLCESVAIARVRIHVERLMGRIKQWHFLTSKIPVTYWNQINHIFQVCARLVLFWPPLTE